MYFIIKPNKIMCEQEVKYFQNKRNLTIFSLHPFIAILEIKELKWIFTFN